MNKNEIIRQAALSANLPASIEKEAVEAFLCAVSDILSEEDEVVIPDFGKFTLQQCAARTYRHPKTSKVGTIPATKRVRFKPYGNVTLYSAKYGR